MKNKVFKINNNIDNLKKLDFRHIGDGIYVHDFPCYRWNGFVTIIGRLTAYDDDNNVLIDIYQEDGNPYAPYYRNDNSEVVAIIISNIKKELKKCGIKITNN